MKGRVVMFTPRRWWAGLLIVVPAIFGAASLETSRFETDTIAEATSGLTRAGFEPRDITVSGRDVRFTLAAALEDRPLIHEVAAASPAVRSTTAKIETLAPVPEWVWSIGRDERGFVLSGTLPSRTAAADLTRRLRSLVPGVPVTDLSRPSAGAPTEFAEQVAFAALQATRLATGSVAVGPAGMIVSGDPASPAAALEVITDLRAAPTRWHAHADAGWGRPAAFGQRAVRVAALATTNRATDAPTVAAAPVEPVRVTTTLTERPALPAAARASTARLESLHRDPGRISVTIARLDAREVAALRPIDRTGATLAPTAPPTRLALAAAASLPTLASNSVADPAKGAVGAAAAVDEASPSGAAQPLTTTAPPISPPRDASTTAAPAGPCSFVSGAILPAVPTFKSGSAHLGKAERAKLRPIVAMLAACPSLKIALHGHADLRGSKETNDRLSLERASGVQRWLAEHGIAGDRMSFEGFGSSRLAIADGGESDVNRRVEIRVM